MQGLKEAISTPKFHKTSPITFQDCSKQTQPQNIVALPISIAASQTPTLEGKRPQHILLLPRLIENLHSDLPLHRSHTTLVSFPYTRMGRASRQNDEPSCPLNVNPKPFLSVYSNPNSQPGKSTLCTFHCGRCGKDVPHGPPVTCAACGAKRESAKDEWR